METPAIAAAASQLRDALRFRVVPAVPVPFTEAGDVDAELQRNVISWMTKQPVGAVAVWAHTGRGLHLTTDEREQVLNAWREGLSSTVPVICGVGVPANHTLPTDPGSRTDAAIRMAVEMAEHARRGGARGILLHPPTVLRDLPDRENRVLAYHRALTEVGVPTIGFFLYEAAGGVAYAPDTLTQIVELPGMVGFKIATLDSVMTFQDLLAAFPDRRRVLTITGEDRFLGYSLMMGAECALVGIGAACTDWCCALAAAWTDRRLDEFHKWSWILDEFARATFVSPMEGYVQRMLWALEADGVLPRAAIDRHRPFLEREDRELVFRIVPRLRREAAR